MRLVVYLIIYGVLYILGMLDEKHMKFFRSFFRILCGKDGLLHCGYGSNGSTFGLPLCAKNRIHLLGGSSHDLVQWLITMVIVVVP